MEPGADGQAANGHQLVVRISRRGILARVTATMGGGVHVYHMEQAGGEILANAIVTMNAQRRVLHLSRCTILAEAMASMGGSAPVYQVERINGGCVATVWTVIALNCHPGCHDVLRATGRRSDNPDTAREAAAMRLLQDLARRRRIIINDLHYSWVGRTRRQMAAMRIAMRELAGDPASQEVYLLWSGRRRALTYLRSVREACEEVLSAQAADGVLDSWVGEHLSALDSVNADRP